MIVKENKVGILRVGNVNYISLTDLAKYQNSTDPSFTVKTEYGRNFFRLLSKLNYVVHTDAVKTYIVPMLTEEQKM